MSTPATSWAGSSGHVAPRVQPPIDVRINDALRRYEELDEEEMRLEVELKRNFHFPIGGETQVSKGSEAITGSRSVPATCNSS